MQLLKADVENFGSYKHLEFDYSDKGLALLYGPTGAGKSTIMDIAPWVLFGVTAKNGSADDVRNWSNPKETTRGTLRIRTSQGADISVTRIRGVRSDLYISSNGTDTRGRDIRDTQKIINQMLGCDETLYLLGSYYCDASPAARFFEAAARDRRSLLERCTDLRLPVVLGERCAEARKGCKRSAEDLSRRMSTLLGAAEQTRKLLEKTEVQEKEWAEKQASLIEALREKERMFDRKKSEDVRSTCEGLRAREKQASEARISNDEAACPQCGAESREYRESTRRKEAAEAQAKELRLELERLQGQSNPYPEQIEREKSRTNSHTAALAHLRAEAATLSSDITGVNSLLKETADYMGSLETLADLSLKLRGVLLATSVREVEEETNRILDQYFSGEFRVGFTMQDDDLEVSITKNGYNCSFRQLSKGQRQILRLSFSVSLMKRVSAQSGVQFENLFLDEPADGGDSEVKAAAFRLFQELAIGRDSVMVIDHAQEFQSLFERKLAVSINGDYSEVRDAA